MLGGEQFWRKAGAVCEDVGRHLSDALKTMARSLFYRNNNYCVMGCNFSKLFSFKNLQIFLQHPVLSSLKNT